MNANTTACLLGVSLGPGDPDLLTRRAFELLQGDRHWAYPVRKIGGESYALDIARRAGLEPPGDHTPLVFPMTSDPTRLAKAWLAAAQSVLEILHRGKDVAFLVEGDASTYSTFGHLARSVAALDATIRIETVPGVASFSAAAARLGLPLADSDEAIAILPAGYGTAEVERLLEAFDTLVLLKIKPLLDPFISWLASRNLLADAYLVEKVGTPEERIVRDVATLRGETVPGVASFSAAAARLGLPLADSDEAIAILPAGYGTAEVERLLEAFDTLVLLKIKPLLDPFISWLASRNLLADAYLVEKVGTPEERIVRDVATLRGETVHYLSLLLVRNPRRLRQQPVRGCRPKPAVAGAPG